jgi:glycerol-3-phosphate O-acyltransferase
MKTVDRDATEEVGLELMKRIEHVVPVLPVPLLASVLLAADGPMSTDEILKQVKAKLARMPDAHIHMPRDDVDYAVEVGLRSLKLRRMARETEAGIEVVASERDAVRFYANSIAHLEDADAA